MERGGTPSAEEVKRFWADMTARHGTRVILKSNAWEMRLVAKFLSTIGVLDAKRFMTRYTTIIGRRIYTPWEIGEGSGQARWSQLVTCVHETQHAIQQRRDGPTRFARRYITSREARARYEAEAYRCNMELRWWRTGVVMSPRALALQLKDYGCRPRDIDLATTLLKEAAEAVSRGEIATEASREAIAWLEG